MSLNQIIIILSGEDQRVLNINSNKIILASDKLDNINQDHTLLQTNFESIEDLMKAVSLIKNQFLKVDEVVIINRDIDLHMISYQYNYDYIKKNYQILINVIYFINLIVPIFSDKLRFVLSFDKDNHYKVHLNNFKNSLVNYVNSLKKDLNKLNNIEIKKLD